MDTTVGSLDQSQVRRSVLVWPWWGGRGLAAAGMVLSAVVVVR
jgi:hypothetical protein